jgi:hypothetical protein
MTVGNDVCHRMDQSAERDRNQISDGETERRDQGNRTASQQQGIGSTIREKFKTLIDGKNLQNISNEGTLNEENDLPNETTVFGNLKSCYQKFIENPPMLDFFNESFRFDYTRNQDLNESELDEICDEYGIAKSKKRQAKGYSLNVIYLPGALETSNKKCIIFFYRQTESLKYNILLAEAEQSCELSRSKFAVAGGTALGATLFMCSLFNPLVAAMTLTTSSLAVAHTYYQSKDYGFQDVVLGYMIHQLEAGGVLLFRDSQCFLREGGQLIAISEPL